MATLPLLRVIVLSMGAFLLLMIIANSLELVSVAKIEQWIRTAQISSTPLLIAVIIGLLMVDIALSIPTLFIAVLSGFFLGAVIGAITVFCGLFTTVSLGYWLGNRYGSQFLHRLAGSTKQQQLLAQQFQQHSTLLIVFARAVPMLPEISAILSGSHGLPYRKFLGFWALGTAPYCVIACYSGSLSTTSNPAPAITGMLLLMAGSWLLAGGLRWYLQKHKVDSLNCKMPKSQHGAVRK